MLSIEYSFYKCFHLDRRNIFQKLKEFPSQLLALNLFYNRHKSSLLTVRNEIRATRLYVILFISIFIILLLYNVLEDETVTITIQQPTQTTYEHLYSSFSSSLQCPCSQITLPYRSFVEINTRLHQICSSSFIETAWIESIYGDGDWSTIPINEFRVRGVAYFFVLQSLCTIAKGKTTTAGAYFFDNQIISGQVIPENQLRFQINSDIDQLRRSFASTLIELIQFVRDSTQGNHISLTIKLLVVKLFQKINFVFKSIPISINCEGHLLDCLLVEKSTLIELIQFQIHVILHKVIN